MSQFGKVRGKMGEVKLVNRNMRIFQNQDSREAWGPGRVGGNLTL